MGISFFTPKSKPVVFSPHFWIIVGLLVFITISHFHELLENVPVLDKISITVFFGTQRHTEDRILYTLIIAYASWAFGVKAGCAALVLSAMAMLPRSLFISSSLRDALVETLTAIFIGMLLVSLIEAWRRIRKEQRKLQEVIASLRLSEENYRELFQNASDAIWIHDLEGVTTAANRASETITGYTADELLGKNIAEFLSEDNRLLARKIKSKLLSGEPVEQPYEQQLLRKDGKELIVELTTRLITHNGQPLAFQNIARDITQRKSAEEMLSKIIDGSPIPSFVINKQHKVTHWNTAIESLSGVKKLAIIGTDEQWRPFYTEKRPVMADLIVDGASAEEVEGYYQGKCKKSYLIDGAYEAEDFFPALGDNGRWLHFTASPIKDNNGEIVGAIETLQDVTERQNALEALNRSEKSFRDLFESALDAIWVHDLQGNIQVANEAAAKLSGYPLDELCRANIMSLLTEAGQSLAREVQAKLIQHQSVDLPYEQRLLRKGGVELVVELTTRLITQNGQPVAFQNIARDVTQQRKMRNSMRFYLQKVLVAQEEERKRIARELHDDAGQSLLLLIHRLDAIASDPKKKLSKPDREKLTQLHSLAVETLERLRRYAQELRPAILDDLGLQAALEWMADNLTREHGIDVDVQLDILGRDLPHEVQLALFRIAQEALGNIRRHAGASKAVVKLESGAGKIRMTITDNGKGFEVPTPLSDLGGTGKLGLMGMKERAQLLRGTLDIQSEIDKGTTITVEIPLEE